MNQAPDHSKASAPIDDAIDATATVADPLSHIDPDLDPATMLSDRRRRLTLLAICAGITVVFLALSVPFLLRGNDEPDLGGGVGSAISPPRPVQDFTLIRAGEGTPLSISDLRGKPTLLSPNSAAPSIPNQSTPELTCIVTAPAVR